MRGLEAEKGDLLGIIERTEFYRVAPLLPATIGGCSRYNAGYKPKAA